VQSAIALHTTPDDFTQALLLLIAALYVENTLFQDYNDDSYGKSIYRFLCPKRAQSGSELSSGPGKADHRRITRHLPDRQSDESPGGGPFR
jgi:hypothetical protein